MRKSLRGLVALYIASLSMQGFASGLVGNGGDTVECRHDPNSDFGEGLYSLDYLLTFQTRNGNADVVQVKSWRESAARIEKLLSLKHADLHAMFVSYLSDLENYSDFMRSRVWVEAGFGLVDIKDEQIIHKLPRNCLTPSHGPASEGHEFPEEISITQAIIQTRGPDLAQFDYDPKLYERLSIEAPLQLSFLLVHEWLWELSSDVQVIRRVNRFLHSSNAETLSENDFKSSIYNLGINLVSPRFKPMCERVRAVREAWEQYLRKPCDQITYEDTANLRLDGGTPFRLPEIKMDYIPFEDFNHSVFSVNMAGMSLKHIFTYTFSGYSSNGYRYDLSRNNLTFVPWVFRPRPNEDKVIARQLDLSENKISKLPTDKKFNVAYLNLSKNLLQELDFYLFDDSNLTSIVANFSQNQIRTLTFSKEAPDVVQIQLNLSGNELKEIDSAICRFLKQNSSIDLSGNPLSESSKQDLQRVNGTCSLKNIKIIL